MRGDGHAAGAAAFRLARGHYENFPVLSRFVPPELRLPLASIYAFARHTDDLGDEGSASPDERLAALEGWERGLDAALADGSDPDGIEPVLTGLARTIRAQGLPVEPFRALIHANRLDQLRSRYPTYGDLLRYCAFSANPVGRIVLRLFGRDDASLLPRSDAICTGLQLANHWQGIGEDLRLRDRLYIPLEDLRRFGVREDDLLRDRPDRRVRRLVGHLVDRTRALLDSGASLPDELEVGPAAVVRLFLRGGRAILDEIDRRQEELLRGRVRVGRGRTLLLLAAEGVRWDRG